MTAPDIMTVSKEQLPKAALALDAAELPMLVATLCEKDDALRYQAFLALQYRSRERSDVYPFWDTFQAKLSSDNSYQRSIGMMLLAENVRWDAQGRMAGAIDAYLERLNDEKPITVRQCIQSLGVIWQCQPELGGPIAARLSALDLMQFKETMRKSILLDALRVLIDIRNVNPSAEADQFIMKALTGGILDAKTKKQVEATLCASLSVKP